MDEKQAPGRSSGIPRLSRLPLPKPSPVVRPSPSREGLNNAPSTLRNPRLRPAASRDQLAPAPAPAPAPTLKKTEPRPAPKLRREIQPPTTRRTEQLKPPQQRPPAPRLKSARSLQRLNPNEAVFTKPPTPPRDTPQASPSEPPAAVAEVDPTPETPSLPQDTTRLSPVDGDKPESHTLATPRDKSKPRPSLAERTIETLSQLPSSPALSRKPSAFFDPDGASRPRSRSGSGNSRPGSSYTSDGSLRPTSRHSRPGSSSGPDENPFANVRSPSSTYRPLGAGVLSPVEGTPARRVSGVRSLKAPAVRTTPQSSPSGRPPSSGIPSYQSPSPTRTTGAMAPPKTPAAAASARTLKPRASANGLFKKPSLPTLSQTPPKPAASPSPKPPQQLRPAKSYGSLRKPTPTKTKLPAPPPPAPAEGGERSEFRKASASLRDQIAKARAAKREADRQAAEAPSEPEPAPVPAPASAPAPAAAPETTEALPPVATINPPIVPADQGFNFGGDVALSDDPFNTKRTENATNKIIQQRLGAARSSGRLNIAAMDLTQIPPDVLKMYDVESLGTYDGSWAETVDLTRLVAADNLLETIDDAIFPDVTPEQMAEDEDSNGNIFGGLEVMDLHGNRLVSLPPGLRQLRLLTSLNLSSNRLANSCLQVITEVTALRDLKLANNLMQGPLDASFAKLENLEIFDLHGNNVSSLPAGIENLSRLRILNLSENSFESLPFVNLAKLPLTELLLKKNKLSGTLIEDGVEALPNLQMLDLSSNQLTRLVSSGSTIGLPSVHQLVLSMNRLRELPDVTTWTSLLTLTANENAISDFPVGFTSLDKLRHVDFSGNDIRVVPPEISRMDNLSMIRLSGNPLRDKKFVSATTEELKEVLAGRLEPPPAFQEDVPDVSEVVADAAPVAAPVEPLRVAREAPQPVPEAVPEPFAAVPEVLRGVPEITPRVISEPAPEPIATATPQSTNIFDEIADTFGRLSIRDAPPVPPIPAQHMPRDHSDTDDFATPPTSSTTSPARARSRTLANESWPVKSGGVLDRSNTKSSSLHPVVCSRVAADNKVREIQLHHNLFTCFPNSLSFFAESLAALSLAHNQLVGETYLTEELELPALRELNLVSNHITSLTPLTSHLHAPHLEKMDVSLNRIAALPLNLRIVFPRLVVLLAANNHLVELDPEAIKGLEIVDAGNNDIAHLNPRIGLLGGRGGLKRLEVSGNRFRVPRWNVLERGTDATLRWLRGRVPVAEMAQWKEAEGDCGSASDTSLADVD